MTSVANGYTAQISAVSSSSVSVGTYVSTSAAFAASTPFVLKCERSTDSTPVSVYPVNITPDTFVQTAGVINPVHFSASWGATATTACTAANTACAYLDQIGNYVSNITRGTSVGLYTLNAGKTYSKIKCASGQGLTSAAGLFTIKNPLSCNSCSAIPFITIDSGTNPIDSYGTLMCDAIP